MVKAFFGFWFVLLSAMLGCLFIRNRKKYKNQSRNWIVSKSLAEFGILILGMFLAPGFVIGLIVAWIIRPINNGWAKAIVGIASGIILGVLSTFAMEGVAVLGVFAIDTKTGLEGGAISRWRQVRSEGADLSAA